MKRTASSSSLSAASARQSISRHLRVSGVLGLILVAGIGGWATATEISGAVIAPGSIVVDTNIKKVQHPTGGVVGEIRVRDGDKVRAGDIVMRLDETVTRASLAVVVKSLDENAARRARLEAERDGQPAMAVPPELAERMSDPDVSRLVTGEAKLFEIRMAGRDGQKAQLRERIGQLREQIAGLDEQIASKKREVALIYEELKGVRELWSKSLVQITRVTALERDAARLEGERGALVSTIAQTRGRITETELQILQVDQDLRTEVGKELAEIRARTSELVEKKVAAEDQLKRIDIRSPMDGTVHQLAVHTIGAVVSPSEPIMLIVPEADVLTVEVRLQPQDVDQVRVGQRAVLRFPAFNQRVTPEVYGEVSRVSADVSQDAKTGMSFYTVRIGLSDGELGRLGRVRLVPGMPVESFIQTGDRTVLSYLTKPLTDQVAKAFRER